MKTTSRIRTLTTLLAIAVLGTLLPSAHAQRGGRDQYWLLIGNVNWQGENGSNYNPFDETTYRHNVSFDVVRRGNDATEFFVTFSKDSPGDSPRRMRGFGNRRLDYQIYSDTRLSYVLKDLPQATVNEVLSSRFDRNESRTSLDFVVTIPAGQTADPGFYFDRIRVTLYEGDLNDYRERATRLINIFVRVEESADIAILEIGEAFDERAVSKSIDFEELEEGESRTCDLRVRSNTRYSLSLSSKNRGHLFHTAPGDNSRVEYFVTVDNQSVRLDRGGEPTVARGTDATSSFGNSHPMRLTIGELGSASFGTYEDELTITLRTN